MPMVINWKTQTSMPMVIKLKKTRSTKNKTKNTDQHPHSD